MACHSQRCKSLNCPEENDETLSGEFQSGLCTRFQDPKTSPDHSDSLRGMTEGHPCSHRHDPQVSQSLQDEFYRYDQQAPYPSQANTIRGALGALHAWCYPSYHNKSPGGSCPNSLPSYLPSADYLGNPGADNYFPNGPRSLPGAHSPSLGSLERPGSLHSFPPAAPPMHGFHSSSAFSGPHHSPPCCMHYGPVPLQLGPLHHPTCRPGYHLPHRLTGSCSYIMTFTCCPMQCECSHLRAWSTTDTPIQAALKRKVFVTYEADSEDHLKEVIKFVAMLRNNGFDTHIDVFEQQLNSISKIDCMERYLNEKDYLIIIIISLQYFETVTGTKRSLDCDERTSNTVYIHKQLQSEFIRNGCKNFRFIPVLFPGAKKSYVPSWLQHTHVYRWPRDWDDILRRLMRVEKYSPPPIGPLPTIV
ncbi:hypothetical protein P4O66_006785, partial [Electrophorus voltai]